MANRPIRTAKIEKVSMKILQSGQSGTGGRTGRPTGRPVRCGTLRYFAVALAISIHLSKFSSPMFFLIFS